MSKIIIIIQLVDKAICVIKRDKKYIDILKTIKAQNIITKQKYLNENYNNY